MHHFILSEKPDETGRIVVTGEALKHMNVLRIRPGEAVTVSDGDDRDYYCTVLFADRTQAVLAVDDARASAELPAAVTLYQGFPKADKMELIIQKAVELGAARVVPVNLKRCVAKPEEKRLASRLERWNTIARSAAEQSGRSTVPAVTPVMTLQQVLADAQGGLLLVPYESADGMKATAAVLQNLKNEKKIGILIGPEGGFDPAEIEKCAQAGAKVISLGRRILRTETAGLVTLSALMLALEMDRDGT